MIVYTMYIYHADVLHLSFPSVYDNNVIMIVNSDYDPSRQHLLLKLCMFCTLFRSVKYRHTKRDGTFRPYSLFRSVPCGIGPQSTRMHIYLEIIISCDAVNGFFIYGQFFMTISHKCTVSPGTSSLQPLVELPALLQAGESQ